MYEISASTEVRLLFPPIGATIAFVLTWNIERNTSTTGKVSPKRFKAYALACVGLMLLGYGIVWQDEIKGAWSANPYWMFLGLLGIAACVLYLALSHRRSEETQPTQFNDTPSTSIQPNPEPSVARRILAWIVIAWGVAGLLGGIAAVIRNAGLH